MKTFAITAAAALLATTVTAVSFAATAPAPARPPMAAPATVTWAEVKARGDALWSRLDVNKDGKIDQADRDAEALKRFDSIDTNHDGVISKDEFLAHVRAAGPHMGWHPGGPAGPDGAPPPPPPPGGPGGPGEPDGMGPHMGHHMGDRMGPHDGIGPLEGMALHQAAKNGVIVRADFDAALKADFDKIDTNHDGKISPEERHAAMKAAGMRRGEWGPHDGPHDGPMGDMPPPPPPPAQ